MALYHLYVGLGGGFGGAQFSHAEEFESRDEAIEAAYELAVEEYESYGGFHGLESYDSLRELMQEEALQNGECPEGQDVSEYITDEMVDEAYREEVDGWIQYYVRLADEDGEYEPEYDE